MDSHPIENLMKSTMENIREMVDVNTIIGDSITADDGTLIIPISKVSFGFVSGGTEFNAEDNNNNHNTEKLKNYPFGGGSGSGISIKPVAFLVIKKDCIRLLPLTEQTTCDKIVDLVPQLMDMVKNMSHKHKNCEDEKEKDKCCKSKKDKYDDDDEIID